MDKKAKILAVEDDIMFQELLQAIFSEYELKIAGSGEEGLELAQTFKPDIILLDINLPGIDGYQTCKSLKEGNETKEIPALFLSQYHSLEDRVKAYGVGGIDYISKPFNKDEVLIKVEKQIARKQYQDEIIKDLNESYDTVLNMQQEIADVQVIGRFLQANLYCRDFDSLFELFFKTSNELDVSCILQIKNDDESIIRSDSTGTSIPRLEKEILEMSDDVDRIFTFGKDRALFNWDHAKLLVRNLGTKIDLLAILMNGLDASIQVINSEQRLLLMVADLEEQNGILKDEISDLFSEMSISLQETILSLGLTSSLEPDEEDKLNDQVRSYHQKVDEKLNKLSSNNKKITSLIDEMRSPSDPSQEDESSVVDGISFF